MMSCYFDCSHDDLEKGWKKEDYELKVLPEADCLFCLSEKIKTITQIGADRFNLAAGICIPCITATVPYMSEITAQAGFRSSQDFHNIRVNDDNLDRLLSKNDSALFFNEEEIKELLAAVRKNRENPDLQLSKEYKKKKYQCKSCLNYKVGEEADKISKEAFDFFISNRSHSNYLTCCFGCRSITARGEGCSILTCPTTQCATQICVYCFSDPLEDEHHSIKECSEKIHNQELPLHPHACICKEELESIVNS